MEQYVGQMVSERRVAPQPVFNPEGAVQDGIILLGRMQVGPDPAQSRPGAQIRQRDMGRVIPNQTAPKCGPIARQDESEDERARDPWHEPVS